MIFRSQIKLLVTNPSHGVIQFSFSKHVRAPLAIDGQINDQDQSLGEFSQPQELMAQVGAFRDIYWTYHGEKVSPAQVAKFYFCEFVRATRVQQTSRLGNQLLLDELKTFLNGKGFDI